MDEAVEQRHDDRCVQAVPGDVADKERLALVGHGDEVEEIPSQTLGHAVLHADAGTVADRRTRNNFV